MTQRQTITGFFENKAEAQQAVQYLLKNGFTTEQVAFSTQKDPVTANMNELAPTIQKRISGRFFFSLFGRSNETHPATLGQGISKIEEFRGRDTQVSVAVYSTREVDQAVDLLKGAREVTIDPLIG